ncbi:hypothetical protein DFJ73DRAFT_796120 [Zopfochytrium polystomum]|nr:hypothetical protein DFJ73DRAFT_796120 [Zopfochytrium polystomum]
MICPSVCSAKREILSLSLCLCHPPQPVLVFVCLLACLQVCILHMLPAPRNHTAAAPLYAGVGGEEGRAIASLGGSGSGSASGSASEAGTAGRPAGLSPLRTPSATSSLSTPASWVRRAAATLAPGDIAFWSDAVFAYDDGDFAQALSHLRQIKQDSLIIAANMALVLIQVNDLRSATNVVTKALKREVLSGLSPQPHLDLVLFCRWLLALSCTMQSDNLDLGCKEFLEISKIIGQRISVDFTQLGLNYSIHLYEVLFNAAVCLWRLGLIDDAAQELADARLHATTQAHLDAFSAVMEAGFDPPGLFTMDSKLGIFKPPASIPYVRLHESEVGKEGLSAVPMSPDTEDRLRWASRESLESARPEPSAIQAHSSKLVPPSSRGVLKTTSTPANALYLSPLAAAPVSRVYYEEPDTVFQPSRDSFVPPVPPIPSHFLGNGQASKGPLHKVPVHDEEMLEDANLVDTNLGSGLAPDETISAEDAARELAEAIAAARSYRDSWYHSSGFSSRASSMVGSLLTPKGGRESALLSLATAALGSPLQSEGTVDLTGLVDLDGLEDSEYQSLSQKQPGEWRRVSESSLIQSAFANDAPQGAEDESVTPTEVSTKAPLPFESSNPLNVAEKLQHSFSPTSLTAAAAADSSSSLPSTSTSPSRLAGSPRKATFKSSTLPKDLNLAQIASSMGIEDPGGFRRNNGTSTLPKNLDLAQIAANLGIDLSSSEIPSRGASALHSQQRNPGTGTQEVNLQPNQATTGAPASSTSAEPPPTLSPSSATAAPSENDSPRSKPPTKSGKSSLKSLSKSSKSGAPISITARTSSLSAMPPSLHAKFGSNGSSKSSIGIDQAVPEELAVASPSSNGRTGSFSEASPSDAPVRPFGQSLGSPQTSYLYEPSASNSIGSLGSARTAYSGSSPTSATTVAPVGSSTIPRSLLTSPTSSRSPNSTMFPYDSGRSRDSFGRKNDSLDRKLDSLGRTRTVATSAPSAGPSKPIVKDLLDVLDGLGPRQQDFMAYADYLVGLDRVAPKNGSSAQSIYSENELEDNEDPTEAFVDEYNGVRVLSIVSSDRNTTYNPSIFSGYGRSKYTVDEIPSPPESSIAEPYSNPYGSLTRTASPYSSSTFMMPPASSVVDAAAAIKANTSSSTTVQAPAPQAPMNVIKIPPRTYEPGSTPLASLQQQPQQNSFRQVLGGLVDGLRSRSHSSSQMSSSPQSATVFQPQPHLALPQLRPVNGALSPSTPSLNSSSSLSSFFPESAGSEDTDPTTRLLMLQNLSLPEIESYLQVNLGVSGVGWKPRWCVLRDRTLYVVKSPVNVVPLAVVPLANAMEVMMMTEKEDGYVSGGVVDRMRTGSGILVPSARHSPPFSFKVVAKSENNQPAPLLFMGSDDQLLVMSWVSFLAKAIKGEKKTGPGYLIPIKSVPERAPSPPMMVSRSRSVSTPTGYQVSYSRLT